MSDRPLPCHNGTLSIVAAFVACVLVSPAHALDAMPAIPATIETTPAPTLEKSMARIELSTGAPMLIRSGHAWQVETGATLRDGDVLDVPEGARVRLQFNNGDALHLGGGTLLGLKQQPKGWLVQFWRGAAAVYAAPGDHGRGTLETSRGSLESAEGKLGAVVPEPGGAVTVYAFNNWRAWEDKRGTYQVDAAETDWRVDAIWHGAGEPVELHAGQMLLVADTQTLFATSPDFEVDFTYQTSPESEALRQAVQTYDKGDGKSALQQFTRLQQAFPMNAMAAYYLGQIALESDKLFEAIRQWQLYIQINPAEASRKGIPERLTLLVNQQMKDEIESALKLESSLTNAKPEPGSVAVLPYVNRGDAAQAVLAKGLTALIVSDLTKVPGLKVLERAKLQKLVDELSLSQSGLVEQQSALRAGRLMRAEKLLIGDYKVDTIK
jgi:hypothetical protein